MTPFLFLLVPIAGLLLFCVGVIFWTGLSHLKFADFYRREGIKPPPLSSAEWIHFYIHTLQGALSLLWWSIRAAGLAKYRQPSGSPAGRPVLCVHGIFMNSTCMWGIRTALAGAGRGSRAISLGIPFPTPLAYAGPLTSVMEEMAGAFPQSGYDIVAHSLGGVLIREVLRRRPELASSIGRVVTLGSPHHGTGFLRWMRFGPVYKILNRNSTYLRDLPTLRQLAPSIEVTTVASRHDLVVYPTEMAHLDGARQVTLEKVSHLGMMVRDEVMRVILDTLDAESVQPGQDSGGKVDGHG